MALEKWPRSTPPVCAWRRQAVANPQEKQGGQAWVAGSVGPLGVRLEPLGKTGLDEARAAFAEQIGILAEGGPGVGVDLLIIETMPALNEAHEALVAAREMAPHLPVLAMVTVDDESNCLDGSSPEQAAAKLTEWGAGAIGVNCSTGPATVLTAIEAMRKATTLPLAAMPNAGMPRAVEGRNIYLCSPEYMASFAAAKSSLRACRLWVAAAEPHPTTFVPCARPCGHWMSRHISRARARSRCLIPKLHRLRSVSAPGSAIDDCRRHVHYAG